jgi:hypothetical protein
MGDGDVVTVDVEEGSAQQQATTQQWATHDDDTGARLMCVVIGALIRGATCPVVDTITACSSLCVYTMHVQHDTIVYHAHFYCSF